MFSYEIIIVPLGAKISFTITVSIEIDGFKNISIIFKILRREKDRVLVVKRKSK